MQEVTAKLMNHWLDYLMEGDRRAVEFIGETQHPDLLKTVGVIRSLIAAAEPRRVTMSQIDEWLEPFLGLYPENDAGKKGDHLLAILADLGTEIVSDTPAQEK